ncbi:arsenic resistance protein [Desulfovibrio aerotolerans]|uniref:Arsenic resistance protein n=1 Tax=Solidesulfovibrio aerotolerans TaxID=295255 RepID=A0A7C9IU58_9BACT|nr:bile acid:sodium symporter [Solidesulfovibrio aerotolerans]MYL82103.1 arsenic resistance protein [Solidesulfovibrio aerotolerans]
MWNMLQRISKNLVLAIPAAMLVGFAWGLLGDTSWMRALILPFTFLMVYPMMVTLKIREVFSGGDGKAQFLRQCINFGLIPFLAFGVAQLFFPDRPTLVLGLLLAGLVPTSGMTISWTGFAGGKVAAAVKMTVIGLILGSLATPFYVKALLGEAITVNVSGVMGQIALIVFLPMAAGYATQRFLVARHGQQAFATRIGPRFPALSTLGVLGIVLIALAMKAQTIVQAPGLLAEILVPLCLLYGANYLISTILARWLLPRGEAIAMVYGTVMRNLSIALAVAMNAFGTSGSEAALVVALAYVIQVQSAAWYVKLTDRVFGQAPLAAPAPAVVAEAISR